jgi:hypothetical protein
MRPNSQEQMGQVFAPPIPKKKTFATFTLVTKVWLVRLCSNGWYRRFLKSTS